MSAASELDIRWPIGLLFAAMGGLLALYGALSAERTVVRPNLGTAYLLNLNLWWGIVMLLFGIFMVAGAARAGSKSETTEATEEHK